MTYAEALKRSEILKEIENERLRQIRQEGWTTAHDDEHELGEMARAAACYAMKATENYDHQALPDEWPWDDDWWKPKNPKRDLLRAAALIVAEIERLDRLDDRRALTG